METALKSHSPSSPRGRRRKDPWYVAIARALAVVLAIGILVAFSYWAARITLTPVHDRGQAIGNTRPGRTLRFYLDRPSIKEALQQIGGNLVLLAPLGVLLPVVFTRLRGPLRVGIAGGLLSLALETVQGTLVTGRAFDADDVILNTTGVVLAYLLVGRPIARIVRGAR